MFLPPQVRYLEEVLGVSADYFRVSPPVQKPTSPVVVKTSRLTSDEKILLGKILASANIGNFVHVEEAEVPAGATHILDFCGGDRAGHQVVDTSHVWSLPALSDMTGNGPLVTESKKVAWTLLQQFMREKTQ
jgi:hypothetical protein